MMYSSYFVTSVPHFAMTNNDNTSTTLRGGGSHQSAELELDVASLNAITRGVVLFYMPECPHCQDFKPVWREMHEEWAEAFSSNPFGVPKFGQFNVDAEDKDVPEKIEESGLVDGVPSIVAFVPGKEPVMYEEEDMSKQAVMTWVQSMFV